MGTRTVLDMKTVDSRKRIAQEEIKEFNKNKSFILISLDDYAFINNLYKKIAEEFTAQAKLIKVPLFRWDDVPGEDSNKLIEFLTRKLEKDWIKSATIEKSGDEKVIKVSDGTRHIKMQLVEQEGIVYINHNRGNKIKLFAHTENGKQNIYAGVRVTTGKRSFGPQVRHSITFLKEHSMYNDDDIKEFAERFVGREM